jgi:hypothetical protein
MPQFCAALIRGVQREQMIKYVNWNVLYTGLHATELHKTLGAQKCIKLLH